MANFTWPSQLRPPDKGFKEQVGLNVLRTPMDAGPAKMRLRSRKPSVLDLTFLMNDSDLSILDNFIKNIVLGVYRFDFKHPRTNQMVEARVVPQSDGVYYNSTYIAPGYYNVGIQLEILP